MLRPVATGAVRLGPPLAFLGLSALLSVHTLADLGHRVAGGQDAVLFAWYFAWVEHAVLHGHDPLTSGALNAPDGVNLMWNTSVLAAAVVCIPLTATIGAISTVSLLMAFAPALSATVAYVVFRRLGGPWGASALGALLYAYGPFDIGQYGHLHLLITAFVPVLAFVAHRLLFGGSAHPMRAGIALGVCCGIQLLISEEVLVICAVCTLAALVWFAVVYRRQAWQRLRRAGGPLAAAAAVAVAVSVGPLCVQFLGRESVGSFANRVPGTDLAGLVRPGLLQLLSGAADVRAARRYHVGVSESTAYLGWPLIVAAVLTVGWFALRRERFAVWWLLTTVTVVGLELGSTVYLDGRPLATGPWAVVTRIRLFQGVIAARISLVTLFLVAVLIVWTLARLSGWRAVAGLVAVASVLVPLIPDGVLNSLALPPTPRFFTTAAVRSIPDGATTVVLPQSEFPRTQAMVWQIRSGLRFDLVGGYSVFRRPDGGSTLTPQIPAFVTLLDRAGVTGRPVTAADALGAQDSLRRSGVRYIVITEQQAGWTRAAAAAAAVTGCTPRAVADVLLCRVPSGR